MLNQETLNEIVSRWSDTGLTQNFTDKENISLCLQAQFKYNESYKGSPSFKLISIPLLVRVFSESKAFKRNQFVNYLEDAKPSQIFTFGIKMTEPKATNDRGYLDAYAEQTAILSQHIVKELDESFGDVNHQEIVFHHFGMLTDGTITISFN